MTLELDVAIQAARQAGQLLMDHFGKDLQVKYKAPGNPVTELDGLTQRLIADQLRQAFPDYGFLGEEDNASSSGVGARWIVDPIDGTINYFHDHPLFVVSIALEKDGQIAVGVVYAPYLDELYAAEKGKGATLNSKTIQVSKTDEINKAVLGSGFPYNVWYDENDNLEQWRRFTKVALATRTTGSAAYDLCYVAAGRLDGYWELKLETWDAAAATLIVKEAGGLVTQVDGQPYHHLHRNLLASNGVLHQAMLEILNKPFLFPTIV